MPWTQDDVSISRQPVLYIFNYFLYTTKRCSDFHFNQTISTQYDMTENWHLITKSINGTNWLFMMYHQHPGIRSFILFQTPFPSHPWSANVFFLLVCNLTTVLVIFLVSFYLMLCPSLFVKIFSDTESICSSCLISDLVFILVSFILPLTEDILFLLSSLFLTIHVSERYSKISITRTSWCFSYLHIYIFFFT